MNNLSILAEPKIRENLLLAEAVAWLHDFWKCTDEHIKHQALENKSSEETTDDSTSKYLQLVGSYRVTLLTDSASFEELIRRSRRDRRKSWLVRTLAHCHNVAHTEKEEVFYHVLKQPEANTRSSSSFGYESQPLRGLSTRLYHIPFDQVMNRSEFKAVLENAFRNVCADTRRPINEVTLWDWSNIVAALYKAALAASVLKNIQEDPSEMRWRLLSVRFNGIAFSERVARIPDLLARQKLLANGLDKVRTLLEETYPLGTEVYRDENGSVFIVPARDDLLDLADAHGEKLSILIVREFQAGTIDDKNELQLDGEVTPSLKFSEIGPWFRKTMPYYSKGESYTHQPPLPIADYIKEIPSSYADRDSLEHWWRGNREDICTVCQLRPQGWGASDNEAHYNRRSGGKKCPSYCQTCKALERRVCGICEQRREDRSQDWATNERNTTIWIDEIADVHGRIALVVGKFDLKLWIDGTMLFYPAELTALQVRCLSMPLTEGQVFTIRGNEPTNEEEDIWEEYIWNETLKALVSIREVKEDQVPAKGRIFCEDLAERTSRGGAIRLIKASDSLSGFLEVEQSFKIYSMVETQTPARLHRVWETTRKFWEETKRDFKTSVGEVHPRLRIRGKFEPKGDATETLGEFHTYELKFDSVNLSVVYVKGGEFLTVDNLERTAVLLSPSEKVPKKYSEAADHVLDRLRRETKPQEVPMEEPKGLPIEEPTGYGSPNKNLGTVQITEVTLEQTPYIPAITIFTDPRTFMAIVPADKALEVAKSIKSKYEQEMGKVRNRLPLALGLVFADRRTPLPAILDAGRRVLKQPIKSEEWIVEAAKEVIESPNPYLVDKVVVSLKNGQQSLSVEMRTVMGDGTTGNIWHRLSPDRLFPAGKKSLEQMNDGTPEDIWYSYWWVKKDRNGSALIERERQFKDGQDAIWIHVRSLQVGDVVHFMPPRFDFEFLDTAAQRFEVSYDDNGKRRGSYYPARPYYLEQLDELDRLWNILSTGLATSQIHNLIEIIETKRVEWSVKQDDTTFQEIVRDALANANWKRRPNGDDSKYLEQAALSGQLADVVELHMHILKESTKVDGMGGNQ